MDIELLNSFILSLLFCCKSGLSEGRIRAVTKYHLERFGSPFKCAEALIESVLDYQREEEQQQGLDDGDADEDEEHSEQSSSAIVREGKNVFF